VHGEIVASDVAGMPTFGGYSCAQRTLGSSTFGARIRGSVRWERAGWAHRVIPGRLQIF
jgi:hypothetical protein